MTASKPRDERLGQFFGGYFNQDWDADGARSWRDVISDFVLRVPREDAIRLASDLRSWLAEAGDKALENLPASFGCDYDPRPDAKSDRHWVQEMADAIDNHLSS